MREREIYLLRVADHLVEAHNLPEDELPAARELTARHRKEHRRRRRTGWRKGWHPHRHPRRRWAAGGLSIDR